VVVKFEEATIDNSLPPYKDEAIIMRRYLITSMIVYVLALIMITGICNASTTITEAVICLGVDEKGLPVGANTVFSPEEEILYLWFSFVDATPDTVLLLKWYQGDNIILQNTIELNDAESGTYTAGIYSSYGKPFKEGDWRVEMSVEDELLKVVNFRIGSAEVTEPPKFECDLETIEGLVEKVKTSVQKTKEAEEAHPGFIEYLEDIITDLDTFIAQLSDHCSTYDMIGFQNDVADLDSVMDKFEAGVTRAKEKGSAEGEFIEEMDSILAELKEYRIFWWGPRG
jgi:hypothetical protein